ncbi:Pas61 [Actinoplanes phage phiAsp2]|uniref:Pas61 n=1 Tax=Actinoplanes phage phiAsp2 TaxID=279303 RepID=Q6J7X0_9CAUD|nr:Pas61 [Actinoplanes phage phiAsp2]AAT36809.1 Pas61 [Actinoplanes phage phiAsp2]
MGADQFGDSDKSRRIPREKIEKAKEKPPADTTKKPEKTDKD